MLNKQGFDLWAGDYDQTVQLSEEKNEYPFAGYKSILNSIYNDIMQQANQSVLDIGVGTGVLATKLYESGHLLTGIDFSSNMIAISQEKMPNATILEADISKGVPVALVNNHYDYIVSTYTLHHLEDAEKVVFLNQLSMLLKPSGHIIIGDISFETMAQLALCKQENQAHWDDSEYYFVYDEMKHLLTVNFDVQYIQVSSCGGLYKLTKKL